MPYKYNVFTEELDMVQELSGTIALNDLSDVDATGPSDNDVLTWDTSASSWIPEAISLALDDLSDVDATGPSDDDSLTWDSTASAWVPQAITAGDVGGLYGINIENLTGDKTLTADTDKIYQYLDTTANRIVTLATASAAAGDRFSIRYNGDYDSTFYLTVKQSATILDYILAGGIKEFIFDGTNWVSAAIGTGENDSKKYNIGIGWNSVAYNFGTSVGSQCESYHDGVAIGYQALGHTHGMATGVGADGHDYGVAFGMQAIGYTQGVAVGFGAEGFEYGIAIGYTAVTSQKKYSIALLHNATCVRTAETTINIDGNASAKNNVVQGRWSGATANDTPVEILCGAETGERFTVRARSALAFKVTVVARDNVADHAAMYTFDGLIKRNSASNTTMSVCNKTVVHEDDATWDVDVTADDTNEALIITVTGDATNSTQFAAVLEGVETHF